VKLGPLAGLKSRTSGRERGADGIPRPYAVLCARVLLVPGRANLGVQTGVARWDAAPGQYSTVSNRRV
jgi:hypothetical protein